MRCVFQKIVIFSFLLQALIPVGFMPAFAKDGTIIVICSGITGEAIEVQIDETPNDDDHHDKTSSKCAYSNVGAYTHTSIPNLVNLDTSYILTNEKLTNFFVKKSTASSSHKRGPPHISLT